MSLFSVTFDEHGDDYCRHLRRQTTAAGTGGRLLCGRTMTATERGKIIQPML
jgi:hypothetical protein